MLKCYDPKTGAFAEPGGKPDVAITSIGVMAAMELGIPKEKFAKAMDYLKENAKTFEEVRIGAAAVEAWGVKDCPFKLEEWIAVGTKAMFDEYMNPGPPGDRTRTMASAIALVLRLRLTDVRDLEPGRHQAMAATAGQRDDGGLGQEGREERRTSNRPTA